MNIIILGPQGSGKGTQADIISKKYNIPHISSGDIFRDEIEKNTNLGKTIKRLINQGNLVPDDLTAEIIKNKLSKSNLENGVIFDGFPRNLHQAEFLDEILKINLVFEVWINDKESIKRISGRRSCPKCAKVFHLKYNPPTKP
ncbi:MAG: nucleoside monophosphate kinase, partial [Patescibacteria group bacterium]